MDKLENHIKNKLQEREITPSSEAWKKISAELSNDAISSHKKTYWWAIVAGLAGLVLLSIGFFSEQKSDGSNEVLVLEEETEQNNTQETENDSRIQDEVIIMPKEKLVLETTESSKVTNEEGKIPLGLETNKLANIEVSKERESFDKVEEVTELDISKKLVEVIAKVNAMEDDAVVVSDAEIDSLLMRAQKELLTDKVLQTNGKVDAMALLNEVEAEIYDDQRNPLFIRLKEGFFKLRTAVADRNN